MKKSIITNPIVVGSIIGATASMYAMSKMSMSQRRKIYRTSKNMDRFANRIMDRIDSHQ